MEYLCPVCNGLDSISKSCSKCGSIMKDSGRIQDYYDDYSPYLSYSITNVMDNEPGNICQHLFSCPVCGYDNIENIDKIFM